MSVPLCRRGVCSQTTLFLNGLQEDRVASRPVAGVLAILGLERAVRAYAVVRLRVDVERVHPIPADLTVGAVRAVIAQASTVSDRTRGRCDFLRHFGAYVGQPRFSLEIVSHVSHLWKKNRICGS